jgi:competence transcription factor ComK
MKKTLWVLATAFLMLPLSANASVSTNVHSGTTTYVSTIRNTTWSLVELRSVPNKSLSTLNLGIKGSTNHLFSNKAQLITDGVVSNLKLTDTYRNPTNNKSQEESHGVFRLNPTQVDSIKQAKEISLKVTFYGNRPIIWKVSEKMLKEWNEVLAKNL